jgi:hypothetical protein
MMTFTKGTASMINVMIQSRTLMGLYSVLSISKDKTEPSRNEDVNRENQRKRPKILPRSKLVKRLNRRICIAC